MDDRDDILLLKQGDERAAVLIDIVEYESEFYALNIKFSGPCSVLGKDAEACSKNQQ